MPELGVNAIYKAVRAVSRLESFDFGQPAHPVMGKPTMNVGTFQGGNRSTRCRTRRASG